MASEMGSRIDGDATDRFGGGTGRTSGPAGTTPTSDPLRPGFPPEALAVHRGLLDPVSGLPGWVLLLDRTTVALSRARRTHRAAAVFVLDEPTYRIGGAEVPVATMVDLLRERIRPDDTLAYLDRHRYAVLCPDLRAPADAERIAERLVKHCGDLTFGLGMAVGGAGDDAVQLISWAAQHANLMGS